MSCTIKLLSIITFIGLLILFIGFISLFHKELGFSSLMTSKQWDGFQMATIAGGLLITTIAGTIAYVFKGK
jgi:hypothetical protein